VPNASPAALARWDRPLILAAVVFVTALAWAYLMHLDRQMASGIEHGKMMEAMGMTTATTWTATDFVFTFAMWAVMMIGMMTPSAVPVLVLFAASQRARGAAGHPSLKTVIFGLGYVTIWTSFSAAAALAQFILHQTALLSAGMAASNAYVSAAILIAAGAYQLTPWKNRCLTNCRSPLGFLISDWRDHNIGAFEMGAHHGLSCLGCCWALMGVLFVVGVMNLVWVAVLTVFILIEKTGPAGAIVARVAGAAMMLVGVLRIF